jgi:hypothetical protein
MVLGSKHRLGDVRFLRHRRDMRKGSEDGLREGRVCLGPPMRALPPQLHKIVT